AALALHGQNHREGETVPREAHREGSRPRRAAGMEDPPPSAARRVDAGDIRAGAPHRRVDRALLANRCRTAGDDVDRRAAPYERRFRAIMMAKVARSGLRGIPGPFRSDALLTSNSDINRSAALPQHRSFP